MGWGCAGAAGTWCWQQRQQIVVKYTPAIGRYIFSDLVADVERIPQSQPTVLAGAPLQG